jgi:parallel beta-helix repeat protein
MFRRTVSGITLTLLLISMLTMMFNIQPVKASGTIYIRADGSVEPSTANITSTDNVTYTFISNIYDEIVVERDNIVVDGAGFTLQGTGSGVGIRLDCKSNVTIQNTHITDFDDGVVIGSSSNNTLSGNTITNSQWDGVFIFGSSYNNTLYGNNISNNKQFGVSVSWSSNNTFSGNVINDNTYNFDINGDELSHFMHSIDVSNLVDGKPIYYLVNQNDLVITPATYPEIGYLALINSINITVENLTLKNNGQGLLLANTNNSRVTDNNIRNNYNDVFLVSSFNNTFSGNNITNSRFSCVLLIYSSKNTFHHNNFIDNYWTVGVFLSSANFWDDGYPSGGNYWSDYTGVDAKSGPNQDQPSSDGIADTAYVIYWNNQDNYPLMNPYFQLFGDLNDDRKVDIKDLIIVASAYGSYPISPRWNPQADINKDGTVNISDLFLIATRFGKTVY